MPPLDEFVKNKLKEAVLSMEKILDADVVTIYGNIVSGLDGTLRQEIERLDDKRDHLAVVLHTSGGSVEVTERIADVLRHHYNEVSYFVPDVAMSAGTVLVMSGDRIMMDYYSRLGPIDPQILNSEGKLVPALSYLIQFNRMREKAAKGELTAADVTLLNKLDLAELHDYEQAEAMSRELIERWLSKYKFKNWTETETRKVKVDQKLRESRAREIAELLSDNERWHTHGRGINKETLTSELKLKIDDFGAVGTELIAFFDFLRDYLVSVGIVSLVHTRLVG